MNPPPPISARPPGLGERRWLGAFVLLGLWSAPLLLVGAGGDFPLNDDFAYGRATFGWLETGEFRRLPWTYVPLYTHAAFGALAALLFGPSFEALRWVGLVGFALSIAGTWALARALSASRAWAVLAAAVVATNPLFVNLAFTFMTDVPFAALIVWSLVASLWGLERRQSAWLVSGAVLATLAMFSRQTGLALWIASVGVLALRAPARTRGANALLGVGTLVAVLLLAAVDGFRFDFLLEKLSRFKGVVYAVVTGVSTAAVYLGWFTLPVLWPAWRVGPRTTMLVSAAVALFGGFIGIGWLDRGHPPGINMIFDLGIGPIVLHGADRLAVVPAPLWIALSALGLAAAGINGAFLLHGVAVRLRAGDRPDAWILIGGFAALFFAVHVIRVPFFDRHLVPLLPVLLAALASLLSARELQRVGPAAIATLAVMAVISWAGLHDYLEHHRTRNAVIADLIAAGATPETLDAGFEFQGWANYDPGRKRHYLRNDREWVTADDYLVSLAAEEPGYARIIERSYRRWLPITRQSVYGLHRTSVGSEPSGRPGD